MPELPSETSGPPPTESPTLRWQGASHRGSLRSKVVLSLAVMFFLFLTVNEMVRKQVVAPEFSSLEKSAAIRDAHRVLAALNAETEHLQEICRSWAMHCDQDAPAEWQARDLRWAARVDSRGTATWLYRVHSVVGAETESFLRALVANGQARGPVPTSGMTRSADNSLILFAAAPLPAEDDPSQRSFLVAGRVVDAGMVTALRRQTQVDFSLQPSRTRNQNHALVLWEAGPSELAVEIQLVGVHRENLSNLFVRVPRELSARSDHAFAMARNSFILGSIAALLLLLLLLQRIVIGPLADIREHSNRVASDGLDAGPLVMRRNDEIGELAEAYDRMVRTLQNTQTQLSLASQSAGRSEVAAAVIHNVGNVLTNVNSLLDTASHRVRELRISPLEKLATRLEEDDDDDGFFEAMPAYLERLATSLKNDQVVIWELLLTLHDNIRHIHDVIRDQQRHADQALLTTRVDLAAVIDDAIGCCRARLEHDSVTVRRSGWSSITVICDRSLLLQAMINIIGNARHAMRSIVTKERVLKIEVHRDGESVRVSFRDNGCGISSETLRRVFDAHFTTRETGSGLGLHFCAITLKRLGGSVTAASDGPGRGSTFTILLPIDGRAIDSRATSLNVVAGSPAAALPSPPHLETQSGIH